MTEDSEDQKMTALKRAYADMILNMAKESASRILESERGAIRFQHSLSLTKEEALAMLLRLKSIMDSEIKEAEKANLGQVRKIQELEGRLNKAKDTIDYLRSELKIVKTELENKKHTQAKLLDEQSADGDATYDNDYCQECKSTSHSLLCSKSGSTNVPTSGTNCTALKDRTASKKSAGSHDLASFVPSSKEPELYRNGCTQRIRAFEQNLLTGRGQPGQSVDWLSILKNKATICDKRNAERPKNVDLALAAKTVNQAGNSFESKEVTRQASSSVNCQALEFCKLSSIKQRTRWKLAAKCRSRDTDHEKEDYEPCDVDYLRTLSSIKQRARGKLVKKSTGCSTSYGKSGHGSSDIDCSNIAGKNNLTKSCETLHGAVSEAPQKTQSSRMAHLSTGNSKTSKDSESNLSRLLNNEKPELLNGNSIITTRRTVTRHNWHSVNQICRSLQSRTGHTGQENSVREPPLLSTTNTNDDDTNGSLPMNCSKLTTSDHRVAVDLDVSMHEKKVTHGTGNALFENPDLKDEKTCRSSGPAEAGSYRILKTFQRKRKRESPVSNNETVSIEKRSASKMMGDKQIASLEPQKPSLVRESSRDSRRVAQVARQLIALSRKRW
ncbi:uncharacterized protein [Elaeis guineensis]|uniref:Uncharacterized protein LOC105060253 n=1 Tax=Elaeis guineensis var. tenera TaxID=51953 RepID=A0A6I9SFM3_ELAGV|nr:uncharacterized protein LOC105060253 [Elaeis guineensis]